MRITFAPRGILQIDDARIIWRNFRGEGSKFNREGDRNFSLIIPDEETAARLTEDGWNIKVKPARDPDEGPLFTLPVKVKFNDRGPNIYLRAGRNTTLLDEGTVGRLDRINIAKIDMDIRPYDWIIQEGTPNEKTGRTAYLQGMDVIQDTDRFADRYEDDEY